jgi:hypothetical protein
MTARMSYIGTLHVNDTRKHLCYHCQTPTRGRTDMGFSCISLVPECMRCKRKTRKHLMKMAVSTPITSLSRLATIALDIKKHERQWIRPERRAT